MCWAPTVKLNEIKIWRRVYSVLLIYKCNNDIYSNIHFELQETTSWWYLTSWSHDLQDPSGCLLEFCFLFYFILYPVSRASGDPTCCVVVPTHLPPDCLHLRVFLVIIDRPLFDWWTVRLRMMLGQILRETKRHVLGLTSTLWCLFFLSFTQDVNCGLQGQGLLFVWPVPHLNLVPVLDYKLFMRKSQMLYKLESQHWRANAGCFILRLRESQHHDAKLSSRQLSGHWAKLWHIRRQKYIFLAIFYPKNSLLKVF